MNNHDHYPKNQTENLNKKVHKFVELLLPQDFALFYILNYLSDYKGKKYKVKYKVTILADELKF